jgi:hypothetical protein
MCLCRYSLDYFNDLPKSFENELLRPPRFRGPDDGLER